MFVDGQPTITIRSGHVFTEGRVTYVWTAADFRAFVEAGRRALAEWDAEQRYVIAFPERSG